MYGAPQNSNPSSWKRAVVEKSPAIYAGMYGERNPPAPQSVNGLNSGFLAGKTPANLGSNQVASTSATPMPVAENSKMPVDLALLSNRQPAPAAAQSTMFSDKQSGMVTPMSVAGIMQQSMATQPQQRQASRMVS